ncbi:MAG TPA: lactonase family protein [Fimbriimonas sp.]
MALLPFLLAFGPTFMTINEEVDFYIGTYTSEEGSKGIYHARLDTATGSIGGLKLAAEAVTPSFLAVHPNRPLLYAVHEYTSGEVSAYAMEEDGGLRRLNTQKYQGPGPCHLSVDAQGKNVLSASYGDGSLASLPIQLDGSLAAPAFVFTNKGSGPDKGRQEGPHMHAIATDPTGIRVYACDLGTDEILIFRIDPETGKLTRNDPPSGKVAPGEGPRHLAFAPGGRFVYVNNEMGNSVTAFQVLPGGGLKAVQTLSTLPEGESTRGKSTAEIVCHPNGRWLYVSNRGHDSIAAYSIGSNGRLSTIGIQAIGVREPRGFDVDPSGKWLVVGGQRSNDLRAIPIGADGKLGTPKEPVSIDKPVCIVFARKGR